MALYLGGEKVKIALGSTPCRLQLIFAPPAITGILLMSSDGFALKDANGVYVTAKECE